MNKEKKPVGIDKNYTPLDWLVLGGSIATALTGLLIMIKPELIDSLIEWITRNQVK